MVVAITDSLSVSAAFHLAVLPLTEAGRLISGSLHSHAGSTGNRFLMACLLPPCQKTPYSIILACEHGRCPLPGTERACAHSSRPQSCAAYTQQELAALFAESKPHTAVPRWPWHHHVGTAKASVHNHLQPREGTVLR